MMSLIDGNIMLQLIRAYHFVCLFLTKNRFADDAFSDSNSSASNGRSNHSSSVPHSTPELINNRNSSDHEDSKDFYSGDDSNVDRTIPDATHWTPDEVYQYFTQYFPDEAKVFKEQVRSFV